MISETIRSRGRPFAVEREPLSTYEQAARNTTMHGTGMSISSSLRRYVRLGSALLLASAIWLPSLQLVFAPSERYLFGDGRGIAPMAQELSVRVLAPWYADNGERAQMRRTNPEWDFMNRTFLVLSLANMALRDPAQEQRYISAMDRVLDETLEADRAHGPTHFLMSYGAASRWERSGRPMSVFVEGELAMMLGARRLVREDARYREEMRVRLQRFVPVMEASPIHSAESYPNEHWVFCNAVALASTRIADVLDGTDHSALRAAWVRTARQRLLEPRTGLLISSYENDGRWRDGPEGSSLFMAAHALRLVDDDFARAQWQRTRRELGRNWLGFGFSREWPVGLENPADVDSGPTVPFVGANAGASGLALLGAAAFDDRAWHRSLATSLEFAAFPERVRGGLRYRASNGVGDAVMLYSLVEGPLWERVRTAGVGR